MTKARYGCVYTTMRYTNRRLTLPYLYPAGGAYSAPPDFQVGFKGPTSKGRERGEGKGGKGNNNNNNIIIIIIICIAPACRMTSEALREEGRGKGRKGEGRERGKVKEEGKGRGKKGGGGCASWLLGVGRRWFVGLQKINIMQHAVPATCHPSF